MRTLEAGEAGEASMRSVVEGFDSGMSGIALEKT